MVDLSSEEFDGMVRKIFREEIPEEFKLELENIALTIEGEPAATRRAAVGRSGGRNRTLLGLFEGYPKTTPYSMFHGVQPSKITLYEKNILFHARDLEDLEKLIQEVLMHEIAHYFGYNEQQMVYMDARLRRKLGRGKIEGSGA